jgi:hypothetical protein
MKFSALALAVLGLFLLSLIWDGRLAEYIDLRQGMLVFLTGLGCVILAQVVLSGTSRRDMEPVEISEDNPLEGKLVWQSSSLMWLALPLLVSLLFR